MLRYRASTLTLPMLILGSWLALFYIAQSPFQDFLNHGDWTKAGILASICGVDLMSLTATGWIVLIASWLLMVIAMMGPLACVDFRNLQHSRSWAILGYVLTWLCAGIAFHSVGWALLTLSNAWPWLMFNGWSTAALILLVSGIYQLTSTKSRAQMACKVPNSNKDIRGLTAVSIGIQYGKRCLSCCWLLMCLMFLFFPGSVLWMAALSLTMFLDRRAFLLTATQWRRGIGYAQLVGSISVIAINLLN